MIRPMKPSDRRLVANSWLRTYEGSRYAGGLSREAYWSTHTAIVDAILDRATTMVYCDPDDEDHVLGWVCYEPGVVHFVYTKTLMRDNKFDEGAKPGIGTALLKQAGVTAPGHFAYTFKTIAGSRYLQKHRIYGGEYDPKLREGK